MTEIKVLCLTDYYLPGFNGGGPIRTLANMCELLAGDVDFSIFTRDRDLGVAEPYPGVLTNQWVPFTFGRLFYATPDTFSARGLRDSVADSEFDVLYLNSFFSYRASISVYLDRRRSKSAANILIAPRGEFSPGALALKRVKKHAFLMFARLLGFYRDVHWHASSAVEAADILRQFPGAKNRIHIAADPISMGNDEAPLKFPPKIAGNLKIAFVSRISPKKNIDGLVGILKGVKRQVRLSIFGPIEDAAYWQKCLALIDKLPKNIEVTHHGALNPDEVVRTFAAHDIFAFPTHGENFGHVIFEALRAGTPVLVSDRTAWTNSPGGALTTIPLDAIDEWVRKIEEAADRSQLEQDSIRTAAFEYAKRYSADSRTRLDNLAMFDDVASDSQPEPGKTLAN